MRALEPGRRPNGERRTALRAALWLALLAWSSVPSTTCAQVPEWSATVDGLRARLVVEPVGLSVEGRFSVSLEIENVGTSAGSIALHDPIELDAEVTDAEGHVVPVMVGLPLRSPRRLRTITLAVGATQRLVLSVSSEAPGLHLPWRIWTLASGRHRITARFELGRAIVDLPGVPFEVGGP